MPIALKRAYDPPAGDDGYRVLADRVWPRGVSRERLRIDAWLKDLAPSAELRKWFGHEPARWDAFRQRYFHELQDQDAAIEELIGKAKAGRLTLVFSARDTRRNNAVALKEYLEQRLSR